MSNQKYFVVSALLSTLLAAPCAYAGMIIDSHGNVGYDTAAECDAAVSSGTAKFYISYTHKPSMLRAGEARVQQMALKDLILPQSSVNSMNYAAKDYKRGACDIGAARKAGRDGVSKPLQGKYVPYSPDMSVNVYFNQAGLPVRASMQQCDNWFGASLPRPVPEAPVAAKITPEPLSPQTIEPTVQAPVAPIPAPAPIQVGALAAHGAIGFAKLLGIGGLLAAGAIIVNNSSDTGTTGTTGTVGNP